MPARHQRRPPAAAGFPWRLILFGSLFCGLGEFAVRLLVLRWSPFLDRTFLLNPQGVWMGPVAALPAVLVVVGLAWAVTSRMRPDLRLGVAFGAVVFLAAFQASLTTNRVHPLALALLALGIAAQLARWSIARQALTGRLIRSATIALATVAVAGGAGWNVSQWLRERRTASAVPAPGAPNVLFLLLDTVRAADLSAYGYARPTSPFLARLASEGIRFDRAMATAPWTLPSHASFFTGRYPQELNVGWTRGLDARYPTLAEAFTQSGYATAGFMANFYFGTWRFGLGRGFQHYSDYAFRPREVLANSNVNRRALALWRDATGRFWRFRRRDAGSINRDVLDWLDERPAERPFFVFVNYLDAHAPYVAPDEYRSTYMTSPALDRPDEQERAHAPPSRDLANSLRDAYDGAITYLDTQLEDLFHQLEQRGLAENTIIMVSADHGESFAEHGFVEHGVSLFLPELQVPLIMRLPHDQHRGCVVTDWVTLRDIPATLTRAAGLQLNAPFPGYSLLDRCGTPTPGPSSLVYSETVARPHLPRWYPSSEGDLQSLMLGNLHYLRIGAGEERLYDTSVDFGELNDLSRDPAYADSLERARRLVSGMPR